jgi:hypothetical protein
MDRLEGYTPSSVAGILAVISYEGGGQVPHGENRPPPFPLMQDAAYREVCHNQRRRRCRPTF